MIHDDAAAVQKMKGDGRENDQKMKNDDEIKEYEAISVWKMVYLEYTGGALT